MIANIEPSITLEEQVIQMEKNVSSQKIDFTTITACGECCVNCSKKISGECLGCIEII